MSKSLRLEIDVGENMPKQIIGLDKIENMYVLSLHFGEHSQITAMDKTELLKLGEMIKEMTE